MSRTHLARALTAPQVAMLGLSGALGTGIFLSTGGAIAAAGPAIIVSFLITGLMTAIVIFAMTEMTTQHPVEGGVAATADGYLGRTAGFVVRWNLAVVCCVAVGMQTVACATYVRAWWPQLNLGMLTALFSLGIVALNFAAVRIYGSVEFWTSMIKVVVVAGFILLGVVLLGIGMPPHGQPFQTHLTDAGGFAPHGLRGIAIGAVIAIFSYGGCEMITVAAAECRDPRRDIPRAARLMIGGVVGLYVLSLGIIVALIPWSEAAAGQGVAGSPFVVVMDRLGVPVAADALNAILITSAFSAGLGLMYGGTRSLHSLALDKMAPRLLARTAKNGAPTAAVLGGTIGMVFASVLALAFPDTAFMTLVAVLTFGLGLSWLVILVTYLAFRGRRASLGLPAAPSRLWGGPATGGIALFVLVGLLASLWWIEGMREALTTGVPYLLVLIGAGAVVTRLVPGLQPSVLDDELLAIEARRAPAPGEAGEPLTAGES